MRARQYRKPEVKNVNGYWISQFRNLEGKKKCISLGPVTGLNKVTKNEAEFKLNRILEPINAKLSDGPAPGMTFGAFVRQIFYPWKKRTWKGDSTAADNEYRINSHLVAAFDERPISGIEEEELQDLLDDKAADGYSFSVVDHLRWDLRAIFGRAVSKGYLKLNPAAELFTPKNAKRASRRVMSRDDLNPFFSVLDPRERVIGGLAIFAGLRAGEIFGLQKSDIGADHVQIRRRIYRGSENTPKTPQSIGPAALGSGAILIPWIQEYIKSVPGGPNAWLFPSENVFTPIRKDNHWLRNFRPKLEAVGLEWVNYQVMRRTSQSLMSDEGVDPQVRADQARHSVDVNMNRYTQSSMERRAQAVGKLEVMVNLEENWKKKSA